MPGPLILVDGSAYFVRCHHTLSKSRSVDGIPSNANKGVLNIIRRLRRSHPESALVVAFDDPGSTTCHRHSVNPDYRSVNMQLCDALRTQHERLIECLEAMGLPIAHARDAESCDVIAHLAMQAGEQQIQISSPSARLMRHVSDNVSLSNALTGETLTDSQLAGRLNITPAQVPDWLALAGERAEFIHGIPGVTPTIATALMLHAGSLHALLQAPESIIGLNLRGAERLARHLAEHADQVIRNLTLSQLQSIESVSSTQETAADWLRLHRLYCLHGFSQWSTELRAIPEVQNTAALVDAEMAILAEEYEARRRAEEGDDEDPASEDIESVTRRPQITCQVITRLTELRAWVEQFSQLEKVAISIDIGGRNPHTHPLAGFSLCASPHTGIYIPVGHQPEAIDDLQLPLEDVLSLLRPLLVNPAIKKISRRTKSDLVVLGRMGIIGQGFTLDVPMLSYAINTTYSTHSIEDLTLRHLNLYAIAYSDVAGRGSKQLTLDKVAVTKAARYCIEMVCLAWRLEAILTPQLRDKPTLERIYQRLELPLIPVLSRMESTGTLIDNEALAATSRDFAQRMEILQAQLFEMAGAEFNLASAQQIGDIMYNKLGMPVLHRTRNKQPSTKESTLSELVDRGFEFPRLLIEYRSLRNLKITFADALTRHAHPISRRIHPTFQQAVVSTGRLSCITPNLMAIPSRTEDGHRIRDAFIANPGHRIVRADYSQVELRILAHFSQDQGLLYAFQNDIDIHQATASEVFRVPLDQVTTDQRRKAKAINFGLIYGMTPFSLARRLGCTHQQASAYMMRYFARYPGVRHFMERIKAGAVETGYIETLFGRRHHLPNLQAKGQARLSAERVAINAPMQGTAADLIKRAMLAIDRWLLKSDAPARLLLQVHDELVLEVADSYVDTVCAKLRELMCHAPELSVQLSVDIGIGRTWGEASR